MNWTEPYRPMESGENANVHQEIDAVFLPRSGNEEPGWGVARTGCFRKTSKNTFRWTLLCVLLLPAAPVGFVLADGFLGSGVWSSSTCGKFSAQERRPMVVRVAFDQDDHVFLGFEDGTGPACDGPDCRIEDPDPDPAVTREWSRETWPLP